MDSHELLETDFFQTRDHNNLIYLMSQMGFEAEKSGMCYGFALAALYYHSKGKLQEYDNLISKLLEIYYESFKYEWNDKEKYLKSTLLSLDNTLKENPENITITEMFGRVEKFHFSQYNQTPITELAFSDEIHGMYDENDVATYLGSIAESYDNENAGEEKFPLSLILVSSHHALLLVFENEKVLIRDINYPKKHSFESLEQIFALSLNQHETNWLLFNTRFFLPQDAVNRNHILNCQSNWTNSNDFRKLHEMSPVKISQIARDGNSLLSASIRKHDIESVKEICSYQVDLNENIFPKALNMAIDQNWDEAIDILLKHPLININLPDISLAHYYSLTPLSMSILCDDITTVNKLIKFGSDLNSRNKMRLTDLAEFLDNENLKQNLISLFEKSVGFNSVINELTPLHFAALMGNEKITHILLEQSAKILMCDGGICADEIAISMGHTDLAAMILKKGKDDWLNEITVSHNNGLCDEQQMQIIQTAIHNQQSARDCLNIMSVFNKIFDLKVMMTKLDKTVVNQFSDKFNHIYELVFTGINATNIVEINETASSLIKRCNLIISISGDGLENNNEFYDSRNEALLKLQNMIASDESINNVEIYEYVLKGLAGIVKQIQAAEAGRFIKQTIHPDWKNLVKDCYAKMGSIDTKSYAIIMRKINAASRFYRESSGLGFSGSIEKIVDKSIKDTLNEKIETIQFDLNKRNKI